MDEETLLGYLNDLKRMSKAQDEHGRFWVLALSTAGRDLLLKLDEIRSFARSVEQISEAVSTVSADFDDLEADFIEYSQTLQRNLQELKPKLLETVNGLQESLHLELASTIGRFEDGVSEGIESATQALSQTTQQAGRALKTIHDELKQAKYACDHIRSTLKSTIGRLAEPLEEIERIVAPLQPILSVLEEVL